MAPDIQSIKRDLTTFQFKELFVQKLGWDNLREQPLVITCKGQAQQYILRPLVEKRGVKVYICDPDAQGRVPDDTHLRQIEREVTKYAYEHLIIYVDAAREHQAWQWVKREHGKPLAPRVNRLRKGQSGDLLAQKVQNLAIEFEEEGEQLTATVVAGRVRQAFDVERITKKFYDRFKTEHTHFLKFIKGITAQGDQEWYTSLMLNRLMFVYFIQRKGFLDTKQPGQLDGDTDYLPNRLRAWQKQHGRDSFHSFYRSFLLTLFHDGLSKEEGTRYYKALRGTIITLGTFSRGCIDAALFAGAAPIGLIDGEKLLDLLIKYDIGVKKRPIDLYELDEEYFIASEEPNEAEKALNAELD